MILILTSCKKDDTASSSSNKETADKVTSWLDEQKVGKFPYKAANIELLKSYLNFSKLRFENSEGGEKLVIVPINNGLSSISEIGKNSIPNLVLVMNESGEFRKGNIVLYTPENGQENTIAENTFYDIFNTAEPKSNGRFQFLSVSGRRQYELVYKDNRLYSSGVIKERDTPSASSQNRTSTICIDWYIVTTYYVDDVQVDQTWDYVGTPCSEDCGNGCQCESLCPDGSSSSGGGFNDVVEEYEVRKDWSWHVYNTLGGDPQPTGVGYGVNALERIRGKRNSTDPYGGYFISIVHLGSDCNSGCDYGQYTYVEDSWDGSPSDHTTSSIVTGHFPDPNNGGARVKVYNSKTWLFHTVFP